MALITSGSAAQVEGGLAQLKYNKDGKKGWWPLAAVVPIEETLSHIYGSILLRLECTYISQVSPVFA